MTRRWPTLMTALVLLQAPATACNPPLSWRARVGWEDRFLSSGFSRQEAELLADGRFELEKLSADAAGYAQPWQSGLWVCSHWAHRGRGTAVVLWVDHRPVALLRDVEPSQAESGASPSRPSGRCAPMCGGVECQADGLAVWGSADGLRIAVFDRRLDAAIPHPRLNLDVFRGLARGTCVPATGATSVSPHWPLEGC